MLQYSVLGLFVLPMIMAGAITQYNEKLFDNIYGADSFCWDGSYVMVTKGPVERKTGQ
jgi:hypothetical protein